MLGSAPGAAGAQPSALGAVTAEVTSPGRHQRDHRRGRACRHGVKNGASAWWRAAAPHLLGPLET